MKFSHKKYIYSAPFTFANHWWQIIGPRAALHFHVSIDPNDKYPPTCGLEMHHFSPPEYMQDQAPSQLKCDLTGGRCWHDGTSLYASESLWPMIKPLLRAGNHEGVFQLLEGEYINRFEGGAE